MRWPRPCFPFCLSRSMGVRAERQQFSSYGSLFMNQDLITFLKAALECSVYVSPRDPGLTRDELFEIGRRADYLDGEIGDSLRHVTTGYFGHPRLLPSEQDTSSWVFLMPEEPEYRKFKAFDFVFEELNELTRSEGAQRAHLERDVLVERAATKGIDRNDAEIAITWLLMSKQLTQKDNILRFTHPGVVGNLPSSRPTVQEYFANRIASVHIRSSRMSSRGDPTDGRSMWNRSMRSPRSLRNSAIENSGFGGRRS